MAKTTLAREWMLSDNAESVLTDQTIDCKGRNNILDHKAGLVSSKYCYWLEREIVGLQSLVISGAKAQPDYSRIMHKYAEPERLIAEDN